MLSSLASDFTDALRSRTSSPDEILARVRYRTFLRTGTFPNIAEMKAAVRLLRKYNADQPRAPAGSPEGGQWIDQADGSAGAAGLPTLIAEVIRICVATGISRFTDAFGNKSFNAVYECRGGQTIHQSGFGEPDGFIRDPY